MVNRFLNGSNPPDMDEAVKVYSCSDCKDDICAGDTFFKVGEDIYCHDCAVKRFERIAEINEFDGGVAFEQNVNRLAVEMGEGDTDEM